MNADQIMAAFRLIAMGRPNHPEVQALAEHLAKPEAEPEAPQEDTPKPKRKKAE